VLECHRNTLLTLAEMLASDERNGSIETVGERTVIETREGANA
jgi:hypothetical protein